jgi:hypothetical protein
MLLRNSFGEKSGLTGVEFLLFSGFRAFIAYLILGLSGFNNKIK